MTCRSTLARVFILSGVVVCALISFALLAAVSQPASARQADTFTATKTGDDGSAS